MLSRSVRTPRNYLRDLEVFRLYISGRSVAHLIQDKSARYVVNRVLKNHFILSERGFIEKLEEPVTHMWRSNKERLQLNQDYWLSEADKLEEFWRTQI